MPIDSSAELPPKPIVIKQGSKTIIPQPKPEKDLKVYGGMSEEAIEGQLPAADQPATTAEEDQARQDKLMKKIKEALGK